MTKHYGTDALLWFGVSLPEQWNSLIEHTVAQHPNFWTDGGAGWFAERGLTGVVVVTHDHILKPLYGIAIKDTVVEAARGDAQVLDGRFTEKHSIGTYKDFINAALEVLRIELTGSTSPGWCLASMRA